MVGASLYNELLKNSKKQDILGTSQIFRSSYIQKTYQTFSYFSENYSEDQGFSQKLSASYTDVEEACQQFMTIHRISDDTYLPWKQRCL